MSDDLIVLLQNVRRPSVHIFCSDFLQSSYVCGVTLTRIQGQGHGHRGRKVAKVADFKFDLFRQYSFNLKTNGELLNYKTMSKFSPVRFLKFILVWHHVTSELCYRGLKVAKLADFKFYLLRQFLIPPPYGYLGGTKINMVVLNLLTGMT